MRGPGFLLGLIDTVLDYGRAAGSPSLDIEELALLSRVGKLGRASVDELADLADLAPPVLASRIERLAALETVAIGRSPEAHRISMIELTEEGRTLLAQETERLSRCLRERLGCEAEAGPGLDGGGVDRAFGAGKPLPSLDEARRKLAKYGRESRYLPGEHVLEIERGKPYLGFILQGLFRQYTITAEGRDCTVSLLRPGQFMNILAFHGIDGERAYSYEARVESRALIIEARTLRTLSDADPLWCRLVCAIGGADLAILQERVFSLLTEDAVSRLRRFMSREPDASSSLPSYHIASYLGISSETLSRIRKKLTRVAR
jgi:CRP-like cAMP-binding protein